jgi:group II intron reverse transcriptase/maturase
VSLILVGASKQYLILPGFGIISHVIITASNKSIFGYLGMVYGAPLNSLLFRCVASHLGTKTSFCIGSVFQVASVVTRRGKAWNDGGLRCNTHHQDYLIRYIGMVILKNLIRSAGTALSYQPRVFMALLLSVQSHAYRALNRAILAQHFLQKIERKNLNLLDYKTGIIRTTGFNPVPCGWGTRSIHTSQYALTKGYRQKRLFSNSVSLSTDPSEYLDEASMVAELIDKVRNCKRNDGRYRNLIQIIGSYDTLLLAYLNIKSNKGISGKGVDNQTLDGIDINYLKRISNDVLIGKYKFLPVRMVEIPKPGKTELRSLGISSPREKIVQKALLFVLEAVFEEIFFDCSHGFRPQRSCHSALKRLQLEVGNVSTFTWVIEGDIKNCFPTIKHKEIIRALRRRIDCPYTINLVKKLLSAGYIVNKKGKKSKKKPTVIKNDIGIPQGIVVSPLFSNIVLHELDKFVERDLKLKYTIGKNRKNNKEYRRIKYQIETSFNDKKKLKKLLKLRRKTPSKDPMDPNFKRIFYVRYANDWVILVCGSFKDAVEIRKNISEKLDTIGLNLNMEKTRITHLRKKKSRFLGIDFFVRPTTDKHFKPTKTIKKGKTTIKQRFAPRLIYHAPIKELLIKLTKFGFAKRNKLGEFIPTGKSNCVPMTHAQILNYYNSKIRGILNYYSCCHNRIRLWSIIRFLRYSCALSLAKKFKLKTLAKTFKKFGPDLTFVNDKDKVFKIFRPKNLKILSEDERFNTSHELDINKLLRQSWTSSLTKSQFDEPCAICGTMDNIEIHHIRSVKNIRMKTRTYAQWVGGFLRKSIPLCSGHHIALHSGKLSKNEVSILSKYRGKSYPKKD